MRKVAFITGTGGFLGSESARSLARQGIAVAVCDINPETVKATVDSIKAFDGEAFGIRKLMPEEEIFKASTVNSAKALNKEGVWGELEIGSSDACVLSYVDAPFAITDKFSNTVKDTKGYRCNLTVVNGDAVYSY